MIITTLVRTTKEPLIHTDAWKRTHHTRLISWIATHTNTRGSKLNYSTRTAEGPRSVWFIPNFQCKTFESQSSVSCWATSRLPCWILKTPEMNQTLVGPSAVLVEYLGRHYTPPIPLLAASLVHYLPHTYPSLMMNYDTYFNDIRSPITLHT